MKRACNTPRRGFFLPEKKIFSENREYMGEIPLTGEECCATIYDCIDIVMMREVSAFFRAERGRGKLRANGCVGQQ